MTEKLKNETSPRFTFKKAERLCSKKMFDALFSEGHSFLVYPIKIVYTQISTEGDYPAKVAFAVSKKLFKKAVLRNLLKRRMREAYRVNKQCLGEIPGNQKPGIIFIYVGKEALDYSKIEQSMKRALTKLGSRFPSKPPIGKEED